MKKKEDLSRFKLVVTNVGRRDPKRVKAEDVTTLALSPRGRLTIPHFVRDHHKIDGEYYTIHIDHSKDEFLILFHKGLVDGCKKVAHYNHLTYYVEIGPQLKKYDYNIGESTSLPFYKAEGIKGIILKAKKLKE